MCKARILTCGGIERVGASVVKGQQSLSDLQGHMRVSFTANLACEITIGHRGKSSSRLAQEHFSLKMEHAEASLARILLSCRGSGHAIYRDGTVDSLKCENIICTYSSP